MFRSCTRRSLASVVLVACVFGVRATAASEPRSTFRLGWARGEGADACVDERELERRVRARLGRDPFNQEAEQSIEGDISSSAGRWRVELQVRDDTGARIGRRQLDVAETDCKRLTDAIVLAVALTIDPRAPLSEPLPVDSIPSLGAPVEPPLEERPGSCAPCPVPPTSAQRVCPVHSAPECPAPSGISARLAFRALGAAGILPGFAPGVGSHASLGGSRLRFTAGVSFFPERVTGDFAFGLSTANVGACVSADPIAVLTPSLCGEVQAGAMHAVVRELQPLRAGDHAWAGVGVGPEVSVRPIAPVVVEGGVFGLIPVLRPRFAVRGEAGTVFESREIGVAGFLGVGVVVP
jgi:hypothetical protein